MPVGSAIVSMPKIIKNFNLFVDGYSYAGTCDEVRLPDMRLKVDEHRGAAMDVPVPIDVGMEKMDLGFTMADHQPDVFRQFGLRNQNAVQITFRAAMVDDTTVTPYVVVAHGMYQEIKLGTVRNGDRNRLEAMIGLRYFSLTIGTELLIEIDSDNFIRNIDGVDQMADIRAALGL